MPSQKQKLNSADGGTKRNRHDKKDKDLNDNRKEIEFTCSIFFSWNYEDNVNQLCIKLETLKLFAMMNYELTVEVEKSDKDIDINILGIKTRRTYLTEVEPAIAKIFCEELSGRFTLNIIKQDGCTNSAVLKFNPSKNEINLVKEFVPLGKSNYRFCNFNVTAE